ncbi:hypothetical protein [Halomicrobium salinisoli]|uniref:hypothetical protein n=1 Tax=Halomicrobium salinisoli TaxID=2878391 RepID=UPI001CF08AA1|nr:hypothetical protein [Halomicrobium salinisoli]
MVVSAVDLVAYLIGGLIVGGAFWWVLARWVPDGGVTTPYRFHAYQSGVTRRQVAPALALGGLAFAPVAAGGVDAVGLWWALATGVYGGGLVLGAIAVANRPRANLLESATGPDDLPADGPCVVAGPSRRSGDGETLETPVTGSEAVCYSAWVAQYREQPTRSRGTYFTTDFATDRTRFEVGGYEDRVAVDPTGAWLSLAPGSPTNRKVDFEGAATGGSAEREVVVEEGERVPDHLYGPDGPFDGPLPVDGEGRAERPLRFKENAVEPGDAVVAVGEAEAGRAYGETRVTCDRDAAFVARGDYEQVASSLQYATGRALYLAAALAVVGAAGIARLSL